MRFQVLFRVTAASLPLMMTLASPVWAAEDAAPISDAAVLALDAGANASGADIIVIGSPDRLLQIPGSGAVITAQDLTRSLPLSVNEALRQVPGLFPRDEEGIGLRPNIGVRGLNPTRSSKVLLLEDGIPLAFAPYGDNASYYHPPLERFERIEVLKGASQIRFGPQTIGGVVNYITPDAPAELMARLTGSYGSRDTVVADAMIGGPLIGGRVLLHGNLKQSDGSRENQRLRFTDISAKAEWDLGERHTLQMKASRFAENSQVSYSGLTRAEAAVDIRANPFENDRFTTERLSGSISHGWEMDNGIVLRTTGYYHYFDRHWWRQSSNSAQRPNDASDPLCGGMANVNTTCGNEGRLRSYDTWGVESRLTLDHAEFLATGIGGSTEFGLRFHSERQHRMQINSDTPTGRTPGTSVNGGVREDNERDTEALSAFVQTSLDFGRFTLQPGVRYEMIDYARRSNPIDVIAGGKPSGAKTLFAQGRTSADRLIPGIGATFALTPTSILYGGAHRGFAPAPVADIISTGGGSIDLDPELSWNYEMGLRGVLAAGVNFDITGFVMDFDNQIIPASVAGGVGASLTSAGRTLHRGGELSLSFGSLAAGLTQGLDVFARTAITWLPTAEFASTRIATPPCFDGAVRGTPVATGSGPLPCGVAADVEGNRLPYSPEWLYSAAVGVSIGGFTGQIELQGQSALFADDVNLVPVTPDGQRGRIAAWALVNAALSWRIEGSPVTLTLTAKNIFDKSYVADRSRGILPGVARIVQAGVGLNF